MPVPFRPLLPVLLLALGACGATGALLDPAEAGRRAAVEVAVKSSWPVILQEIAAGDGPGLDAAFDAAGVPAFERAARTTQLDGDLALYGASPSALAAAIAVYGAPSEA